MPTGRSFDTLTARGRARRLRRVALAALESHGLGHARLRLLSNQDNVVYRADVAAGPGRGRWVVRVHDPEGIDRATIRSELLWLEALAADTDLRVPRPRRTPDGELVVAPRVEAVPVDHDCVVFRWVGGARRRVNPTATHLARVGRLVAYLHEHAVAWHPPEEFVRPAWTADGVFGSDGFLGPGGRDPWPHLERDLVPTFTEAAARARVAFAEVTREPGDIGLIHADLHLWNVLFEDGVAAAIDFDDAGFGPWSYDLASALGYLRTRPDWERLRDGFLGGYESVRPVPLRHLGALDAMILGRLTGVALWGAAVHGTGPAADPTIGPWIRRVERSVRTLLG